MIKQWTHQVKFTTNFLAALLRLYNSAVLRFAHIFCTFCTYSSASDGLPVQSYHSVFYFTMFLPQTCKSGSCQVSVLILDGIWYLSYRCVTTVTLSWSHWFWRNAVSFQFIFITWRDDKSSDNKTHCVIRMHSAKCAFIFGLQNQTQNTKFGSFRTAH